VGRVAIPRAVVRRKHDENLKITIRDARPVGFGCAISDPVPAKVVAVGVFGLMTLDHATLPAGAIGTLSRAQKRGRPEGRPNNNGT
jgi:hypothetical protein